MTRNIHSSTLWATDDSHWDATGGHVHAGDECESMAGSTHARSRLERVLKVLRIPFPNGWVCRSMRAQNSSKKTFDRDGGGIGQ